jgi:hypothetical protein
MTVQRIVPAETGRFFYSGYPGNHDYRLLFPDVKQ